MRRDLTKHSLRRAAIVGGALTVLACPAVPAQAGFFDFLFGGAQDQPAQQPQSYAEPPPPALGRVAPPALGPESVRQGGGGGRVIAYCVRLCDGHPFPLGRIASATPVETCRAMCPASQTKVFYGSEIGGAVAKDGAHYADLDSAFVFRQQLVANCTCNGRNARGLAPFDLSSDPTLKPGDIVSTKDGLMAYTGKNGAVDAFTPVDPASIASELNSDTSHAAAAAPRGRAEALADANAGAKPQPASPADLGTIRGQISR